MRSCGASPSSAPVGLAQSRRCGQGRRLAGQQQAHSPLVAGRRPACVLQEAEALELTSVVGIVDGGAEFSKHLDHRLSVVLGREEPNALLTLFVGDPSLRWGQHSSKWIWT